ncbi:MAG: peptidase M6, partial [Actinomycetota bacterium]
MRRRFLGLAAAILLLATLAPGAGAQPSSARRAGRDVDVGVRHVSLNGKDLRLQKQQARRLVHQASLSPGQARLSAVGDEKFWLAVDFIDGSVYLKAYTLRGVGNNSEVWVASDSDEVSTDTDFPEGDCRNGLRTQITDDQVNYLIDQFDNNILPKESDVFSVAPPLDGSNAFLPEVIGDPDLMPPDYFEGDGDNTVVLVDNVRDENFFDTNNQNTFSYVAGFFASDYSIYFDRNVMTIDAF